MQILFIFFDFWNDICFCLWVTLISCLQFAVCTYWRLLLALSPKWSWRWSHSSPPGMLTFSRRNFSVKAFHLELSLGFSFLPRIIDIGGMRGLGRARDQFKSVQILTVSSMARRGLGETIIYLPLLSLYLLPNGRDLPMWQITLFEWTHRCWNMLIDLTHSASHLQ